MSFFRVFARMQYIVVIYSPGMVILDKINDTIRYDRDSILSYPTMFCVYPFLRLSAIRSIVKIVYPILSYCRPLSGTQYFLSGPILSCRIVSAGPHDFPSAILSYPLSTIVYPKEIRLKNKMINSFIIIIIYSYTIFLRIHGADCTDTPKPAGPSG